MAGATAPPIAACNGFLSFPFLNGSNVSPAAAPIAAPAAFPVSAPATFLPTTPLIALFAPAGINPGRTPAPVIAPVNAPTTSSYFRASFNTLMILSCIQKIF